MHPRKGPKCWAQLLNCSHCLDTDVSGSDDAVHSGTKQVINAGEVKKAGPHARVITQDDAKDGEFNSGVRLRHAASSYSNTAA